MSGVVNVGYDDLNALAVEHGPIAVRAHLDHGAEWMVPPTVAATLPKREDHFLRPCGIGAFMAQSFPPRELALAPILPTRGLAMLYAARGIGKTYTALGMAYAIATGGTFLDWRAAKARSVCYVDGELPPDLMQQRLRETIAGSPLDMPPDGMFDVVSIMASGTQVNLADPKDRERLERRLGEREVLILDNRSSLVYGGRENDAESWDGMQQWLLRLRQRGKTVLLIEHANRSGEHARGTSKREDVMDTVIHLRRPDDYDPTEGARFEVHLPKARGIAGPDAAPFEAALDVKNGATVWERRPITKGPADEVARMTIEGKSVREISAELGIPKSTVGRMRQRSEGVTDLNTYRRKKDGDE